MTSLTSSSETFDSAASQCTGSTTTWPKGYRDSLHTKLTEGRNIPRFYQRKKAGELLPMTQFLQEEAHCSANYNWSITSHNKLTLTSTTCWADAVGCCDDLLLDDSVCLPEMRSTVDMAAPSVHVQAAAARIYNQGFDALTFILEFKQLVRLFSGIVDSLVRLLAKGDVANTWLQYRYGWRILYYDIVSFYEAVESLESDRKRFSQKSGSNQAWDVSSEVTLLTGAWGRIFCDITDHYEVSFRGTVVADIDPPKFRFDPIQTVWEKVKFSFIIDWIVGIGQWLAANSFLSASSNYTAAGGVKLGVRRTVSLEKEVTTGDPTYDYEVNCSMARFDCTFEHVSRSPTSVSRIPHMNVQLDIQKVLDLLAIIYRSIK